MSSEAVEEKKVKVMSSDGQMFELSQKVALQWQTLKRMIEVDCADQCIPIPQVTGKILEKVIEYCKKHVEVSSFKELRTFDLEFIKVDQATLFDLIQVILWFWSFKIIYIPQVCLLWLHYLYLHCISMIISLLITVK